MASMHRALFSLVVVAACGARPAAPPRTAGPAPASTAPAPAPAPAPTGPACLPTGDERWLAAFTADDRAATVCLEAEGVAARCVAIDLATGAATAAARPVPAAHRPATLEIRQDKRGVQLCRRGACTRLDLPPPPADATYHVDLSDDGALAVAAEGGLAKPVILDAATGKRRAEVTVTDGDYQCFESATFLGQTLYVLTSVCAGPGGQATLYRPDGTQLRALELSVNPYGASPVHLGGARYAILDWATNDYAVIDATTGAEVRAVAAPCDDCDGRGLANTSDLARTPAGKVVTVGPRLVVSDPTTGKIERDHALPMCDE